MTFIKPLLLTLTLLCFLVPQLSFAQTSGTNAPATSTSADYVTITEEGTIAEGQGFVPCEGSGCSACHLVVLVNTIVKWLITMSFLLFSFLAVKAGVGLVISGGNPAAKSAAKTAFNNAFIGLFIILGAWLLIDTLLKGILDEGSGFGPWSEIQCGTQLVPTFDPGDPAAPVSASGGSSVPRAPLGGGASPVQGCTGSQCVPMGIPCKAGSGCTISSDMASRLKAFHEAAAIPGARSTEGMPPKRKHQSACHKNGRCIDYGKEGGLTGSEIKRATDAAVANGLRPVYEVGSQTEKNKLVNEGAPAQYILVLPSKNGTPQITAPHFSIYGY